jgi:hypothetical protein
MKTKSNKHYGLLGIILLLAAGLRFYGLERTSI